MLVSAVSVFLAGHQCGARSFIDLFFCLFAKCFEDGLVVLHDLTKAIGSVSQHIVCKVCGQLWADTWMR